MKRIFGLMFVLCFVSAVTIYIGYVVGDDFCDWCYELKITHLLLVTIITLALLFITPRYRRDILQKVSLYGTSLSFIYSLLFLIDFYRSHFHTGWRLWPYYLIQDWGVPKGVANTENVKIYGDSFSLSLDYLNLKFNYVVDGISLGLVLLTTFLFFLVVLVTWTSVTYQYKDFLILMSLLQLFIINAFTVGDFLLFYIFFELTIFTMLPVVVIWGSRDRKVNATYQFLVYTLIGAIPILVAIIYLQYSLKSTHIDVLKNASFYLSETELSFLWLAIFLGFAIKVPTIPVHIWLPEAHSEAPTAGSMILAGLLLKLGGFGYLRYLLIMSPEVNTKFGPLVSVIFILGIIYSGFATISQIDLKRIIAYASIGHMNVYLLGLFSGTMAGVVGSVYGFLTHGLVSAGLFFAIGCLYDRTGSRTVTDFGGLLNSMPVYGTMVFLLIIANMGLPLTANFISEILVFSGAGITNIVSTFFCLTGIIFTGIYSIWCWVRMFGGSTKNKFKFSDINAREFFVLSFIIFLVMYLGILPGTVLSQIITEACCHLVLP